MSQVSSSPIVSTLIKLNVMKLSACLNVFLTVIGQDGLNICFKGIHQWLTAAPSATFAN